MPNNRIFRDFEFERDAKGQVCKMFWRGDTVIPTQAEIDRERLAGHERIYGKREE